MYPILNAKTDTLKFAIASGATSATLDGGNFGTQKGRCVLVIDFETELYTIIECTVQGAAISNIVYLEGAVTEGHDANAPVGMMFTGFHYAQLAAPGDIKATGRSTAPPGWLICDGSAISRIDYADLFASISTTYGTGDNSTTFNIPNLKGRVPVGADSSQDSFKQLGIVGGTTDVNLSHYHDLGPHVHQYMMTLRSDVGNLNGNLILGQTGYGNWKTGIRGTGSDLLDEMSGHTTHVQGTTPTTGALRNSAPLDLSKVTNLQPYQVVNYIIKF